MSHRRPRASALILGSLVALAAACSGEDEHAPTLIDAAVDAPIDAGIDASDFCSTCRADEVCVQFFNGTCGQISLACKPRHAECVGDTCTPGCMLWACNNGDASLFFRCDKQRCETAVPGAIACQGP